MCVDFPQVRNTLCILSRTCPLYSDGYLLRLIHLANCHIIWRMHCGNCLDVVVWLLPWGLKVIVLSWGVFSDQTHEILIIKKNSNNCIASWFLLFACAASLKMNKSSGYYCRDLDSVCYYCCCCCLLLLRYSCYPCCWSPPSCFLLIPDDCWLPPQESQQYYYSPKLPFIQC